MATMADNLRAASSDYSKTATAASSSGYSQRAVGPYEPDKGGPTSGGTARGQADTDTTGNTTGSFVQWDTDNVEFDNEPEVKLEMDKLDEMVQQWSNRTFTSTHSDNTSGDVIQGVPVPNSTIPSTVPPIVGVPTVIMGTPTGVNLPTSATSKWKSSARGSVDAQSVKKALSDIMDTDPTKTPAKRSNPAPQSYKIASGDTSYTDYSTPSPTTTQPVKMTKVGPSTQHDHNAEMTIDQKPTFRATPSSAPEQKETAMYTWPNQHHLAQDQLWKTN